MKLTFRGTKKEAEEYEARKRLELGITGVVRERSIPTFTDFSIETYKPHAKAHLRASTWSVRRHHLVSVIAHFGSTKLTKLDEMLVESFKLARLQKNIAKITINTELNAFSAVLRYARELKVPCANFKIRRFKIRTKKGSVKFYTRQEVEFILAACRERVAEMFALLTFLFETGARKSEALNLRWTRIDFVQRIVRIWSSEGEQDDDDDYEVKSVEREVTISDHLLLVLKEHKLRGLSSQWVFPVWKNNCGTRGERYANFPIKMWKLILKRATEMAREVDPKARAIVGGPHRCRHTFASHFLMVKPDLFLLGRILGHSHNRVTELYAHLVPDHLAAARNVVTFAPSKRELGSSASQ